ncbi:S24/S26 family peptidase [Qipengyuania sp. ASV99]|uniref:S24/S26 family peptidase n=1 Tax=Qipengyuania sp. ASV99 TaxID=3399681 RepID=UPI003A4C7593
MDLLGFSLVLVNGKRMGRVLPHRSIALFRRKRKVSKGDIVLVKHPEFGTLVKTCAAVTINGRYSLRGATPDAESELRLGAIEGRYIKGTLVAKLFKGWTLKS